MKSLTSIVAGIGLLTLTSCNSKDYSYIEHFQDGFGEKTTQLYSADTLIAQTALSRLTYEEVTRLALPEEQIKGIRIYMQDDIAAYNLISMDTCSCECSLLSFSAQEPSTEKRVRELFTDLQIPDRDTLPFSEYASQKKNFQMSFLKSDVHYQSLSAFILENLEKNKYYAFADIVYDTLPGSVFTNSRMPLDKLK